MKKKTKKKMTSHKDYKDKNNQKKQAISMSKKIKKNIYCYIIFDRINIGIKK